MIRGYKVRLFPTNEQKTKILKSIGACRFIWNYMINVQENRHSNGERLLSGFDMSILLSDMKKNEETKWLSEISSVSLVLTCRELGDKYNRFYNKTSKLPMYKTKKNKTQSYPISTRSIYFDKNVVNVEKIGKIKYKTNYNLPIGRTKKIMNARISIVNDKFILSFCLDVDFDSRNKQHKGFMGIDLGVKELAVVSYDNEKMIFHNINNSRKMKQLNSKVVKIQKSLSRKYAASIKNYGKYVKSKNINKEIKRLRKLRNKISNIRLNYIHQTTYKLTSILPKRIVMETLDVKDLMKNRYIANAIHNQGFGEFIRQMKYKAENKNIDFVQVDRYFPSSKTCSSCGNIKHNLKLSDRIFKCESCGISIDRDYNAAINLMKYGAYY